MDETQLRDDLRGVLDDVTPPADLADRALRQLGPRRGSTRQRATVGVSILVAAALIIAVSIATHASHQRVDVVNTPTTISSGHSARGSIDPITDLLNRQDGVAYRNGVEARVASCMHAKGWSYVPRIENPAQEYGAGTGPTDPIALLSFREHFGYGYLNPTPSDAEAVARVEAENNHYLASLAPSAQLKYTQDLGSGPDERHFGAANVQDSGCRNQVETAARKAIPRMPQAVVHELFARQNGVLTDPAYLAAQAQWSSCMLGAGFHFQHVTDAQASISNLFAPPPGDPHSQAAAQAQANANALARARALEIRTASSDARCAAPTVWPVQRNRELAILQDVIDRYGKDIVCGPSCS